MSINFKPDHSLIREWDNALNDELPFVAPFVSAFQNDGKTLRYIASSHGGDVNSPTLKTVKQEFDDFPPDVVIVEGVPYNGETSPAWYLEHCREHAKDNYENGGEGSYATVLAAERGTAFVGAEPTAWGLCNGLLLQGARHSWGQNRRRGDFVTACCFRGILCMSFRCL